MRGHQGDLHKAGNQADMPVQAIADDDSLNQLAVKRFFRRLRPARRILFWIFGLQIRGDRIRATAASIRFGIYSDLPHTPCYQILVNHWRIEIGT